MKKIIFLDIDGVLNVISQGRDEFGQLFHPHLVDNLKTIIEATGAEIVISSTWRMSGLSEMRRMWETRGLPGKVIGVTPNRDKVYRKKGVSFKDRAIRGHEIQEFIDTFYQDIDAYVILDDDSDMLPTQISRFVKCSDNKDHKDHVEGYGLTKECARKAIEILNKNGPTPEPAFGGLNMII